jgi:hypothetical protein
MSRSSVQCHDPIGTIHQALWRGTPRSSPNVRPSCINIGSAAPLKGLFVWIDDACEQHGSAAAAPIGQTTFASTSNDDTLSKSAVYAILSPGFAAKL